MNIDEIMRSIPTTRYQGSKRKILPWLYECLKDYEFYTVLDAFGGSGVVSLLFKRMGKKVTYNDLFKFNQIIGESIIENDKVTLTDKDTARVLSSKSSHPSFISDNFNGIYYLDDENTWLDMVINNIETLNDIYSGNKLKYKKAIAYNALFQACLSKRPYNLFHRKNLEMRTRDVKRGFGNKTTWDKPFSELFQSFVKEINKAIIPSEIRSRAICKDVFMISPNHHYDLVYLDPPYLKNNNSGNESSDYLKCYHFLEGIVNYEKWGELIANEYLNRRIKESYSPNHFKPSNVLTIYDKLIKKFCKSIIVLSYRYGGKPTIDELSQIILKYKDNLTVYDKHYKYALNKQNGNADMNREYLLIGY